MRLFDKNGLKLKYRPYSLFSFDIIYSSEYNFRMARQRNEGRIRMTNIRREQLLDRCKGRCCHCGCELVLGDNFSIEHIIPLSKGGTNDFRNTVALCKDCNKEKGNDIVGVEFYSNAPKLVFEDIEAILNEYYEENDWLTTTNVFRQDRYTIKTKQTIMLPNGKIRTKDAECEFRKMSFERYEAFIGDIEERKVTETAADDGVEEEVSGEGQPFQITFKGKPVAVLFCGLDPRKDKTIFRMVLTVSGNINWGPSSRIIIIDCIQTVINLFKESVEAKGTKGIALCCIDAPVMDKRAVSVVDAIAQVWKTPREILSDAETLEPCFIRASCVLSYNIDVESEDGKVSFEEFNKKSKLYSSQIRRRVNSNIS